MDPLEEKVRIKRKWIIISIIAVFILGMISAFLVIYYNISLRTGTDLVIKLEPYDMVVNLTNNEKYNVEFELSTTNKYLCKATCSYKILDISNNVVLLEDNFIINPSENKKLSYEVTAPELGFGQNYYNLIVECNNIEERFCITQGLKVHETRLIIVNHEPERDIFNNAVKIKDKIVSDVPILKDIDKKNQEIKKLATSSDIFNVKFFDDEFNMLMQEIEQNVEAFNTNKYYNVREVSNVESLYQKVKLQLSNMILDATKYNDTIKSYKEILNATNYGLLLNATQDFTALDELRRIGKNIYDNYNRNLLTDINKIDIKELENQGLVASNITFNKVSDEFFVAKNKICNYYGIPCMSNIVSFNSTLDQIKWNLAEINKMCNYNLSNFQVVAKRQFTLKLYDEVFNGTANQSVAEKALLNYYNVTNITSYEQDWWNFVENKIVFNSTLDHNAFKLFFNPKISLVDQALCENDAWKYADEYFEFFNNLSFSFIKIPKKEFTSDLKIIFEEPISYCCVDTKCYECCGEECFDDESSYPIIFLHGHAFNKASSPEYSSEGFNLMQNTMVEAGYINAGVVNPITSSVIDYSGVREHPMTFLGTYYYDVFPELGGYIAISRKSESIDVYAIRMKDIVDSVIQKTKRKKVNIVAHSMGGLVARRYMQIFGDDKINKLIMIGTPNHGVDGSIDSYCPLLGERLECRDMSSDSLFLRKLNDPNKQPNVDMYVLIGKGCDMNGKDGDGVVLAKNAFLDLAENYYYNGSCTRFVTWHTEMLQDKKVIDKVIEILAE